MPSSNVDRHHPRQRPEAEGRGRRPVGASRPYRRRQARQDGRHDQQRRRGQCDRHRQPDRGGQALHRVGQAAAPHGHVPGGDGGGEGADRLRLFRQQPDRAAQVDRRRRQPRHADDHLQVRGHGRCSARPRSTLGPIVQKAVGERRRRPVARSDAGRRALRPLRPFPLRAEGHSLGVPVAGLQGRRARRRGRISWRTTTTSRRTRSALPLDWEQGVRFVDGQLHDRARDRRWRRAPALEQGRLFRDAVRGAMAPK